MTAGDPSSHQRRSIRLKGYDYSQAGGYYITIVTQQRVCFLGAVEDGEMRLNQAGLMVDKWWRALDSKYPTVSLGAFVVMPNHFHGILMINDSVGVDQRVAPQPGGHVGEWAGADT